MQFELVFLADGPDGYPVIEENEDFVWSIETAGKHADTTVKQTRDQTGWFTSILMVAEDETLTSLTIKAVSTVNRGRGGRATVTVISGALTGEVSITGFAKVDGTLTVNTAGLGGSGAISYVWKRGASHGQMNEVISGASGDTYTPAADDLGKYLTVTVSRDGYTGSITSPPTKFRVASADAVEPAVSGVTITAAYGADTVSRGGTLRFSAAVAGTGLDAEPAYQAVTWLIETAGKHAGTAIDQTGTLTVAPDERQPSLTIKAVSTLDDTKSGTAAVTTGELLVPPPVSINGLGTLIAGLQANSAASPYTVTLAAVNISTNDVMRSINSLVTGKYIILDLSWCSATNNTISGSGSSPGSNHMNVIKDNQYIVGVILPNSVTSIGEYVFSGCSSLASVTIPGSVTSIGTFAFSGCTSLASVTIPEGVTSIGEYVFSGCRSLASVTIPSGVTSIGGSAFSRCSRLASVTISSGVTSIGDSAFGYCDSLTSVTIPTSVTSIGGDTPSRGATALQALPFPAALPPSGTTPSPSPALQA